MTVIAYRDGIMAADTSSWHGDVGLDVGNKLTRLPDGAIMGAAGWLPVIEIARNWVAEGANPKCRPSAGDDGDLSAVIVRPDRSIWNLTYKFHLYRSGAREMDVCGSHIEFLYGAMLAGASAEEAVRLAIRFCKRAGGDVQVMRLEDG